MTLFITASWRCVNGFQNVIVTGLPSYAAGADPPDPPPLELPPHAAIATAAETKTTADLALRPPRNTLRLCLIRTPSDTPDLAHAPDLVRNISEWRLRVGR